MTAKFQIIVLEGESSVDQATYYCDEMPQVVSEPVKGSRRTVTSVRFVPKNGPVSRVGRVNKVPRERVIAVVEEATILDDTQ